MFVGGSSKRMTRSMVFAMTLVGLRTKIVFFSSRQRLNLYISIAETCHFSRKQSFLRGSTSHSPKMRCPVSGGKFAA